VLLALDPSAVLVIGKVAASVCPSF